MSRNLLTLSGWVSKPNSLVDEIFYLVAVAAAWSPLLRGRRIEEESFGGTTGSCSSGHHALPGS